jgi:hypothetical protein
MKLASQSLQQNLRKAGFILAERQEYEEYLQSEYGPKYIPRSNHSLDAAHRGLLRKLYFQEKRA